MYKKVFTYHTVGIFTFEVDITGTITETGIAFLPYSISYKVAHKMVTTIMNHGTEHITALRNNEGGAKSKFLSEIVRIMNKYPWCGVDIDLERGGI